MCKTDRDCPRGQTCRQGVCTASARRPRNWFWALLGVLFGACMPNADTVPDQLPAPSKPPTVAYSSQIGGDDSDYAADPPKLPQHDGPASFASTTERVLEAAAQGQGGYYGAPRRILEAAECQALLTEAQALVPGCAAEMLPGKCSRGERFVATECPECAKMIAADDALLDNGCQRRPEYPTLRAK